MDSDNWSDSMDEFDNENGQVQHKGRRNIRDIKQTDELSEKTRAANKSEEERKKRIETLEKKFQGISDADYEKELILDFDLETKKPLVQVHKDFLAHLQSHQREGVRFMWNNCYESVEQARKSEGSGCVIAHCMGLGKTFQVIALVHTLLNNPIIGTRTVLIFSPKNVALNWINEFDTWITPAMGEINVFNPTKFDNHNARFVEISRWQSEGGVCIINYELFRILLEDDSKESKPSRQKKMFEEYLCNPGPDLVVCDEGHVLKNEETKLSKVMSKIRTLRRVILTGTPMQNNLKEYHCMIQFVKPNLLGSRTEFLNMFVNPILNGQYESSLDHDVQLMKERSHVLHKTLSGCVQRFDLSTLAKQLPEKQEYVIALRLTDCQANMYRFYLDNYSAKGDPESKNQGAALFADHQSLQRVWTHPYNLKLYKEKHEMDAFKPKKKRGKKNKKNVDLGDESSESESDAPKRPLSWWNRFVRSDQVEDARTSSKLVFLLEILKEVENNGEKMLVFSGSSYSIGLIEHFLKKINNSHFEDPSLCNMTSTWEKDEDYFILTGQTSSEDRAKFCKQFNNVNDLRARLFIISTKAGSLGINLTAANRAVIFDVSWNPCYDIQSIFRIYRMGQKKPCFVYRFLASGTMEEKMYERQVTKQSISFRVVDEKQIARHYTETELQELYQFEPDKEYNNRNPPLKDALLKKILRMHENLVGGYHEHDSLLEHKSEEELHEAEKTGAWSAFNDYSNNSKNLTEADKSMLEQMSVDAFNPEYLKEILKRKYKDAEPEEIQIMFEQALPKMKEILRSSQFREIMKREAEFSRRRKLSEVNSRNLGQLSSAFGGHGRETDFDLDERPVLDPSASNVLDAGRRKNYFSTGGRSSSARGSRRPAPSTSTGRRSGPRPLSVWGSRGGRDYGTPDLD